MLELIYESQVIGPHPGKSKCHEVARKARFTRQSGIFSYFRTLLTGQMHASVFANERFFKKAPGETVERFEAGVGLEYRFGSLAQIAAGVSQFKSENRERETGANIALYLTPAAAIDGWLSYRHADPINDSYTTAREAFTQNILSAGLNLRRQDME